MTDDRVPAAMVARLPLAFALLFLGACRCSALERDRYEAALDDARRRLVDAPPSAVPGCDARVARFRTAWADLPRHPPGAENVTAFALPDSPGLVVVILETDVHGLRRAHAYAEPAGPPEQLLRVLDRCGGGEWERASPLDDGWHMLESRLD